MKKALVSVSCCLVMVCMGSATLQAQQAVEDIETAMSSRADRLDFTVSQAKVDGKQHIAVASGNAARTVWKTTGAATIVVFSLH